MKTFFKTLTALFLVFGASTVMAANEMVDLVKCRPMTLTPDLAMSLTLSAGADSAVTVIKVERFFLGRSSEKSFIVRQAQVEPQQQSVLFLGEDISFEADFNKASIDGGAPAVLKLRLGTDDFSIEELSCQVVRQIPEINFAY
jgi:hypothetical protein